MPLYRLWPVHYCQLCKNAYVPPFGNCYCKEKQRG